MNKTLDLVSNALNLAQAEIRAMYKRVGIIGSNVLSVIDNAYNELSALQKSHAVSGDVEVDHIDDNLANWALNKLKEVGKQYGCHKSKGRTISFMDGLIVGYKSGYAAAPQKGMKWVKASERLPDKEGRYFVRMNHSIPETEKAVGYFTGSEFTNYHGWKVISWLDESHSDSEAPIQKQ